jgi:hypothetical protein
MREIAERETSLFFFFFPLVLYLLTQNVTGIQ